MRSLKALSVCLVATLPLALVAGCGSSGGTDGDTGGKSSGSGGGATSHSSSTGAAGHGGAGGGGGSASGGTGGSLTVGTGATGSGGATSTSTGTGTTSSTGSGGEGGQAAYCMGDGPPILVGDDGTSTKTVCGEVLATDAFRYALCVCQGLAASAPLVVDAFDSTNPNATNFGNGGSVGLNANTNLSSLLQMTGDLQVTGAVTLNQLQVGHDALISDTLSGEQTIKVAHDASVGGDVKCNGGSGALSVTGTLTYPSNKTLTANNPSIGTTVRAAVDVAAPCDCATADLFDISGYVQAKKNANDDASVPITADHFTNYTGDQNLTLPCGRYYFDRIGGQGKINLTVNGRTAVFIGGDVNLSDAFTVTLVDKGELDLFIDGGLTSSAPLNFGDKLHPARVRVYMGGSRNVNLAAGSVFGGNLYAPQSALVTAGQLDVYGSIFVNSFNPSANVNIHYDVAVVSGSNDCPPPATGCTKCQDCGGQACKAGSCGACTSDADCCAPLQCQNGTCGFIVK